MKKSFIYSIAAILALAACSKETEKKVEVITGETVTITAAVDQTRSTQDQGTFSWAADEQISVGTSDKEYVTFDVTDVENGLFSHTFSGATPELLVAVSPAQASAEFAGTDAYEVALPPIYNDYVPSKGVTNALMIGIPDPNTPNKFLFRHAAALLKVTYENVPVGTTGFVLKADKPINSGYTKKFILGGTSLEDIEIANTNSDLASAENPTIINLKDAVTESNTTLSFYVPVPTGEYSLLRVCLVNAGGEIESTVKTLDRTGKSPLTLARGDVLAFPKITLKAAEGKFFVKVTSLDMVSDGAHYVVGAWVNEPEGDVFYAIPANPTLNNGKITGEKINVSSEGIAVSDADGFEWTLSKDGSFWTLMDGSKYLYHSNGGNSGTNLGYGANASFLWSISEWEENNCGLFKFAGVNDGTVKTRGLLLNGTAFGGYALSNYGTQNYSGIDLYVLAGSDERADVELSFATPSYELSIGTDDYTNFTGQVVTTTPAGVIGVKYALTGIAIGSIDENTGTITLDGTTVGKATVTATFSGNSSYKPAASVSYTITVDDPNVVDYVTLNWTYPTGDDAATKDGINAITGVTTYGLGSDYATSYSPYCIKLDGTGDYIQVKTDVAIGEVSVNYRMNGGNNTSTLTIQESTDGEDFSDVEVLTIAGLQDSEGVLTTVNAFNSASRFVKIYFTKGSNVGIGGITITKVDNTPRFSVDSPLDATAAAGDYTVSITRKNFTGAITVSTPAGCDWIVPGNVAANANSFSVHVNANTGNSRTATLTLSAEGVTSQTLVVNQDGVEPGTEANPYTVAQALSVIEEGAPTTQVYVTGIVSKVESFNSTYHSITYYISADGIDSNELEVYSGKGLNGANFNDITDLAVGDQVVVKGILKEYNGTPEFDMNNQIVSITKTTRYTVTIGSVTPENSGTISASATSVGAQGIVTLMANPANGFEFDKWTVTNSSTNQAITVTDNKFVMPASNVSVSATFVTASPSDSYFTRVTDITTLTADDKILIVNTAHEALPAFTGTSTVSATDLGEAYDSTNDRFSSTSGVNACAVTLVNPTTAISGKTVYKLLMSNDYYIVKTSTSGTGFNPNNSSSAVSGDWTLSMDSYGRVNVKNNVSGSTRCLIWRAGTTNKFGAYASSNVDNDEYFNVYIYKLN